MVVVGESAEPVLQALVRWDPAGFAQRELIAERQSAHLPPASRLATLTGTAAVVSSALGMLTLPEAAEVLGPVPVGPAGTAAGPARRGRGEAAGPCGGARAPGAGRRRCPAALVQMQGVRDARKMARSGCRVTRSGSADRSRRRSP